MHSMSVIFSNPLINIAAIAWFAAQFIKTVLHAIAHGHLNLERLTGSGGMPSSHSALVVSLTIGMARVEGYNSPLFALTFAFAAVVMYDAMGVRRAAGEQAKTINGISTNYKDFWDLLMNHPLFDFDEENDDEPFVMPEDNGEKKNQKTLKEYLGHTPLEVTAGALLGILIAMMYPI